MNQELIAPSRKECLWGLGYLLFQMIFLGSLIVVAAHLLGIGLTTAQLNITYFILNFLAAAALFRKYLCKTLRIGLQQLGKCLALSLIGYVVYQAVASYLSMAILMLQPDFSNVNDENLATMSQGNFPAMALCTILLVPVTEELFYRGMIFGGLYARNRWIAYTVSVLVFSLVHISGYIGSADTITLLLCFAQYIPAGLCLAFVYERSGSLLPSILIHTAVNAIGMLAMR